MNIVLAPTDSALTNLISGQGTNGTLLTSTVVVRLDTYAEGLTLLTTIVQTLITDRETDGA